VGEPRDAERSRVLGESKQLLVDRLVHDRMGEDVDARSHRDLGNLEPFGVHRDPEPACMGFVHEGF
jgi:hypothetical protein